MRGLRKTRRQKRKQNAGMIAVDPNVIIDRIRTEYLPGNKKTKLFHFAGHPDRWSSIRPALWISEDPDNYVTVNCGKDEGKSKDCASRDFIWIESIREALVANPRLTNEQLISRFPLPGSDPPPRAQPPPQAAPPPRAQTPPQAAPPPRAPPPPPRAQTPPRRQRSQEDIHMDEAPRFFGPSWYAENRAYIAARNQYEQRLKEEAARKAQEEAYFRAPYDQAQRDRNQANPLGQRADEMLRRQKAYQSQFPQPNNQPKNNKPPSWVFGKGGGQKHPRSSIRGQHLLSLPTRRVRRFSSSKKRRYSHRRLT
jgi:hypothetical protein